MKYLLYFPSNVLLQDRLLVFSSSSTRFWQPYLQFTWQCFCPLPRSQGETQNQPTLDATPIPTTLMQKLVPLSYYCIDLDFISHICNNFLHVLFVYMQGSYLCPVRSVLMGKRQVCRHPRAELSVISSTLLPYVRELIQNSVIL